MIDYTGQRFGLLVVLEFAGRTRHREPQWRCRCDCGKEHLTTSGSLRTAGAMTSCGCMRREARVQTGRMRRQHGHSRSAINGTSGSPTYVAWSSMLARCYNKRSNGYERYGGAGVTVCERWKTFANFLADMGERPAGMTLDRKDVAGNYEPGNCRWATAVEQQRNKRNNHVLTFDGQSMPLAAWAERIGMNQITLHARIRRGWSVEKALTAPLGNGAHTKSSGAKS